MHRIRVVMKFRWSMLAQSSGRYWICRQHMSCLRRLRHEISSPWKS